MPNHVLNKVTISGSKGDIAKCKEQIVNVYKDNDGETKGFSFETVIPMPESLHIEASSIVDDAVEYVKGGCKTLPTSWSNLAVDEIRRRINLGITAINNLAEYGYKDWYNWSLAKWGTKWDCYEVSVSYTETVIYLSFLTAWSTPFPVIKKLSEQHPSLCILVEYADEDLGVNCGTYCFVDGLLTDETVENEEFACELWGYVHEES